MPYTYLPFIEDEKLVRAVEKLLSPALKAKSKGEADIYKNVIDPFSALFESVIKSITVSEWLEIEKARQSGKTFQNSLGDFHQEVIGSIDGFKSLRTGGLIDVFSNDRKIVAEVKNKHNTTKGNHKMQIYDDLVLALARNEYLGFTAYYVEIIPKTKKPYNKPFTPSDNRIKQRRPINERVRVIDGKSFYALATGQENALYELYKTLPKVIGQILNMEESAITELIEDQGLKDLFERAYEV